MDMRPGYRLRARRSDGRRPARLLPRAARSGPRRGRVRLAAASALVAVALDLARELVHDEVERVEHLRRGVARSQRGALQVERRLGHIVVGHARVALLESSTSRRANSET